MVGSGKITGLFGIKPETDPNPLTEPKSSFNMRVPKFMFLKRVAADTSNRKLTAHSTDSSLN